MPRKAARSTRRRRRVCFVTGTRAEFGLMRTTLEAIRAHPKLELQLIVTGMHLDATRGSTIRQIYDEGWTVDRVVPWPAPKSEADNAWWTGVGMGCLGRAIAKLKSDVVLVVGDRVEAFAAAAAGHLAGKVVAHVHGGDRALGQVDDSLRHAITKLAHVHFPATAHSATRIRRLGEDPSRIHRVGTPGLDDVIAHLRSAAASRRKQKLAVILLHPIDADTRAEYERARRVFRAVESIPFERVVVISPNNDPGADGIDRCWIDQMHQSRFELVPNLDRAEFLGLLHDAAVLVGNSSSGIIEAASFGTPVIDVGPRQLGRERSDNVTNVPYSEAAIRTELKRIWNGGRPRRYSGRNVYAAPPSDNSRKGLTTGQRIAAVLAGPRLGAGTTRKLITY